MVWEINMGVCPRLDFENIMLFNCLGYNFNIYGALEFLCNSIANLWRHEWYHYNTLGYPVIIISKVTDISFNGRRNVLLNSYIIDKFAVIKMALYVLGYWMGIHFYSMVHQFSTVYFVFSQIWN